MQNRLSDYRWRAIGLVLCTAIATGCNKADPKTEASLSKLEAENAALKVQLGQVNDDIKKSQSGVAELSSDLKKVGENLNALRLEFAKAAPGIVNLPPPKEERFEKAELVGSFNYNAGLEGSVSFGEPFAHPPLVELDTTNVIVVESTVSGFRWKDKFPKGTDYNFIAKSKWTAKGVRKVLPEDSAKQEEKVKYARQVAELFLKALADHNIASTYNLATENYAGGGNYSDTLSKSLYPRPDFAPISDELKFKSFKVQSASLSPDGKEVLCNGTFEGEHRFTEFVMIVVPTNPSGWRVDRFNVTHKKLPSPKPDKNEKK